MLRVRFSVAASNRSLTFTDPKPVKDQQASALKFGDQRAMAVFHQVLCLFCLIPGVLKRHDTAMDGPFVRDANGSIYAGPDDNLSGKESELLIRYPMLALLHFNQP